MKKKSKIKKLIIILAIIVVAVIIAVFALKSKLNKVANVQTLVQLEEVQKKDLSDFISLTGSVTGETKINYSSSAAVEILTLNVKVGDEVQEGDVIATLDRDAIEKQINYIEKAMSNSAAISANESKMNKEALEDAKEDQKEQLSLAKQDISDAKEEYTAAKKAYDSLEKQIVALKEDKKNAATQSEKDVIDEEIESLQGELTLAKETMKAAETAKKQAELNYDDIKDTTDNAIASAENVIEMEKYTQVEDTTSQTELESLKEQLDDCVITSKSTGIVTAVNVSAGDINTPGTPIVTVEDNQNMVMTASVGETDILKLKEGMKAIITADALEDKEIKGEVIKVIKVFDESASFSDSMDGEMYGAASTGGFSVQIKLEKSELISGMSAKAKIILTDKTDILCVPYDLVKQDESGQFYILCAQAEGSDGSYKAVRKDIQTGEEINYYIEVTGGDVAEGDLVIMDYAIMEGDVFQADVSMFMDDVTAEEVIE